MERLRWHRKGDDLRDLILMRLIAKDEIKKNSATGKYLLEEKIKRIDLNKKRRRNLDRNAGESELAQDPSPQKRLRV
jgi:hypothetical protein